MTAPHWHYANGLRGYVPDTTEIFGSKASAVSFAETMFQDAICEDCFDAMKQSLTEDGGDHDFDNECDNGAPSGGTCWAGAGYVSIEECTYTDCETDDDD